jgi:hypothetical protein
MDIWGTKNKVTTLTDQLEKFRIWTINRWWFPIIVAANVLWWIIDIVIYAKS